MRKKWSRVGVGKTLANDPCGPVSLVHTQNRGIKYKKPPARTGGASLSATRGALMLLRVGVVKSSALPSLRTFHSEIFSWSREFLG
jgi:hypothetical protein